MNRKVRRIHFVGIGGSGMSGMAEILLSSGYAISGSDQAATPVVRRLKKLGAAVRTGHAAQNVEGADIVVYSSAISQANPELLHARKLNIPVMRRAEMLGELMRMKYAIGVSGTHGKTTTTSMIGNVFCAGGLDPTVIVGGIVRQTGSGALKGQSNYLVAEADEFDRSFLEMPATIAVITTLEADHLDCYKDLDEIKSAFVQFANRVPFFGCVVVCLDEKTIHDIVPLIRKPMVTYGFSAQADYRAIDRTFTRNGTSFTVTYRKRALGTVSLQVPGDHNVKNSLAAIAVAMELGIPFPVIARTLAAFEGVRRRFEIKGEGRGVLVVDDYAHHPTEIMASLQGAKDTYDRDIIAVFQPHLYSRTRDFYREFGSSFFNADHLVVTGIYPAREQPMPGITGRLIADAAVKGDHHRVAYIEDKEKIPAYVLKHAKKGDMVITMGAGDIWKTGEKILKGLRKGKKA